MNADFNHFVDVSTQVRKRRHRFVQKFGEHFFVSLFLLLVPQLDRHRLDAISLLWLLLLCILHGSTGLLIVFLRISHLLCGRGERRLSVLFVKRGCRTFILLFRGMIVSRPISASSAIVGKRTLSLDVTSGLSRPHAVNTILDRGMSHDPTALRAHLAGNLHHLE